MAAREEPAKWIVRSIPQRRRLHDFAQGRVVTAVVYLVRHAAHSDLGIRLTGRSDDVPLTVKGEKQAAVVADRLARESLAALHCSPRLRARLTAAAIGERAGLTPEVVPALDEIDFGDWTGSSFQDLDGDPDWRQWNEARGSACPPNGESMAAATARAVDHIERTARAHDGTAVVLVSHCDVIRGVVAQVLGLPLDHLLRFDVGPASVTTLKVGDWGAQLCSLNERCVTDAA